MKTLILLRGLPGSGKSTLAKSLLNSSTGYVEADMFFMRGGEYKFDASKLGLAHAWCRNQVKNWMGPYGFDRIIVSNTFTKESELEPYLELAKKYDYQVVSLIVENRHGNKSVHNVPDETIERMRNRFSIKL